MALKPITLRLDEEEYEKLKEHLSKFGDPDINVAYVLRAYIRDLNRAFPYILNSGWDLKNYFAFLGTWLKQVVAMTDVEMFTKGMFNWWPYKNPMGQPQEDSSGSSDEAEKKHGHTAHGLGGDKKA